MGSVSWGMDVPNEHDDIEGGGVISVSKELHQCVNDACCNFREFDRSDVDRLGGS